MRLSSTQHSISNVEYHLPYLVSRVSFIGQQREKSRGWSEVLEVAILEFWTENKFCRLQLSPSFRSEIAEWKESAREGKIARDVETWRVVSTRYAIFALARVSVFSVYYDVLLLSNHGSNFFRVDWRSSGWKHVVECFKFVLSHACLISSTLHKEVGPFTALHAPTCLFGPQ